MNKWLSAALSGLLLADLALNLSYFITQQNMMQEVGALKRQRDQYAQERNDLATSAARQRADVVSSLSQQKAELEHVQKLLDAQQETAARLSQGQNASSTPDPNPAATPGANPTSNLNPAYQTNLDNIRKDLSDLRSVVDKLKEYASGLEKSLNLPAPVFSSPTSFKSTSLNGKESFLDAQLSLVSDDINQTGADIQSLLIRFSRLQAAVSGPLQFNQSGLTSSDIPPPPAPPGGAIQGPAPALYSGQAFQLVANIYAPRGWPARGPITSPFGPRPNLFGPAGNSRPSGGDTPRLPALTPLSGSLPPIQVTISLPTIQETPKPAATPSQVPLTPSPTPITPSPTPVTVSPSPTAVQTNNPPPVRPESSSLLTPEPSQAPAKTPELTPSTAGTSSASRPEDQSTQAPGTNPSPRSGTTLTPLASSPGGTASTTPVPPTISAGPAASPTSTSIPPVKTTTISITPAQTTPPVVQASTVVTSTSTLPPLPPLPSFTPNPTSGNLSGPADAGVVFSKPDISGVIGGNLSVPPGMEFHTGIDIGAPSGTLVHATADGVVDVAGAN